MDDNGECSWEYEIGRNQWVRYEKNICLLLNRSERGEVSMTVNETSIVIDLDTMQQRNIDTGFERDIRCSLKTAIDATQWIVWEYEDSRRRHRRSFPRKASSRLENAHRQGEANVSIEIEGKEFVVDLEEMTMKAIDGGDSHVSIYRVLSTAADPSTATPTPSVARTRAATKRAAKSSSSTSSSSSTAICRDSGNVVDAQQKLSVGSKRKRSNAMKEDAPAAMKSTRRCIVVKGKAPVDSECDTKIHLAHVYQEADDVYDVMLNQTNVTQNNNKFFIIQLLQNDDNSGYAVWFRWGRVGFKGQSNLVECGVDLEKAKKLFYDKFYDKTRNDWIDRRDFCKVSGKYDLIEMDYGVNENNAVSMIETSNDDVIKAVSSLDEAVQHLVKLICDVRSMEETLIEMEYDTAKAPLGRLTKAQVTAGYEALRTIGSFIEKSSFSKGFIEAINEYYTRIPHSFGMRQPPLIKTKEELKRELDLLEVLQEIEVAIRTMKAEHDEIGLHPLDRHYRSLNCNLIWIAPDSDNYQLVERYLQMTHAPTHNTYKMRLKNLFEVEKDGESDQFQSELGNRYLLWHGSRLTNWFGILSRGLHIAPPEAPVTGYMFGKGLYFADLSSKSANYCFPQRGRPGLLVLAEVALGDWHDLTAADSDAARLPANKHSTRGLGRYGPDPNGLCTLSNGCIVPCGKPIALDGRSNCSLNYNEYVVYSRSQVMLRYLVEVDFEFC